MYQPFAMYQHVYVGPIVVLASHAMPKSLLVAAMCYGIAPMASHPCAQGISLLC